MSPATVLLVEDHTDIREMFALALSSAGLHTVEAPDADAGFIKALALQPAVIITDLRFGSGPDGLAFCGRLKKDPATRHIPVIIVSGDTADMFLQSKADAVGCVAVWLKPVDPFVLVSEVLKIVESQQPKG